MTSNKIWTTNSLYLKGTQILFAIIYNLNKIIILLNYNTAKESYKDWAFYSKIPLIYPCTLQHPRKSNQLADHTTVFHKSDIAIDHTSHHQHVVYPRCLKSA